MDSIMFEAQTTLYLEYRRGRVLAFVTPVAMENGMNVNQVTELMDGIVCHLY